MLSLFTVSFLLVFAKEQCLAVDGTDVNSFGRPTTCAIINASKKDTFCSAVLTTVDTLKTAAHCVEKLEIENTLIGCGYANGTFQEMHSIKSATVHPDYLRFGYDIATIKLNTVSKINPISIISFRESKVWDVKDFTKCEIEGYGRRGKLTDKLNSASIDSKLLQNYSGIKYNFRGGIGYADEFTAEMLKVLMHLQKKNEKLSYKQIMRSLLQDIGSRLTPTLTPGDSGSGLYCLKNDGHWYLMGIASEVGIDYKPNLPQQEFGLSNTFFYPDLPI